MNSAPTRMIALEAIDIPSNRIREADPEKVDELAISLMEVGQLQPIEVRPAEAEDRYALNIGLHRLLAARRVGWTEIEAKVFDGSPAEARLREIDENLYRAELTPYDQAAFLAERRMIYEAMNGPVKSGRKANSDKLSQLSFFDDVTGKFGLPRRMIERALRRKGKISPEAWGLIRGTAIAKNASWLDAIAKLPAGEQPAVVDQLLQAAARNVADAVRMVRGTPAQGPDETEQQLARLKVAWSKASKAARRHFIDFLRESGHLAGRGIEPRRN